MDEIKFEVGQTVYDSFRYAGYEGVVKEIHSSSIFVEYAGYNGDRHYKAMYGIDRKYIDSDAFPTLHPHPYEFAVKEVTQFQKGDLVLWRNNEGHPWNIAKHWGKMEFNNHLVQAFEQFKTHAKFVIPFKNNEHKLWKTN